MAETGSVLDDAELEGIRVAVEIDADDVLRRTRGLTLPPETMSPRVIYSFS
jgi:hypothetical protein